MQKMNYGAKARLAIAVLLAAATLAACETVEEGTALVKDTLGIGSEPVIPLEGTVLEQFKSKGFDFGSILADRPKSLSLARSLGRGLVHSPALLAYVNDVLAKLLRVSPETSVPARVYIVDSGSINASAAPSGEIFLPLGLLENLDSEDELAFVLGHELSHIIYRHHESDWLVNAQSHALEGIELGYDLLKSSVPLQTVAAQDSLSGYMLIGEASLLVSEDLVAPAWTRDQEDAADLLGLDMVAKAGYSLDPVFTLFQKIAAAQALMEKSKATSKQRFAHHLALQLGTPGMENHFQTAIGGVSSFLKRTFGDAHRTPEEREEFLLDYSERYLVPPKPPKTILWNPEAPPIMGKSEVVTLFQHYASAGKALAALNQSELSKAVTLAKVSVSGPTLHATFPRLTFYDIRARQGQLRKAKKNLDYALQGPEVALATYLRAVKTPLKNHNWRGASEIVEQARKKLDDPPILYPLRIQLYQKTDRKPEAIKLMAQCRLDYPILAKSCKDAMYEGLAVGS